jgi:UDP-N-acetylmuramoylalanine--D-glutamate ligase
MDLAGRRVTLMGLGRHGGGLAAARYLTQQGARLTISESAPEANLADVGSQVAHLAIEHWQWGGHTDREFTTAELLVVNPAVRPDSPWVALARRSGAICTSEIELLLGACPAPITAVTGSNGKSTTSAMLAAALEAAGHRVWLGGNNETSLLDVVDQIQPTDQVVLELSSFQLHWLSDEAPWPRLAVVTSFAPNHLDWHGGLAHYRLSKQRLLRFAPPDGAAVLCRDDRELPSWGALGPRQIKPSWDTPRLPRLAVPGQHNRRNAACAAAAAEHLGCPAAALLAALERYPGLPHRLERLGQFAGRPLINDSQATTPESTSGVSGSWPAGPIKEAISRRWPGRSPAGRLAVPALAVSVRS